MASAGAFPCVDIRRVSGEGQIVWDVDRGALVVLDAGRLQT